MRVIDESAGKQSKTKLENLSFEDFCEALVHVALMKVRLNRVCVRLIAMLLRCMQCQG